MWVRKWRRCRYGYLYRNIIEHLFTNKVSRCLIELSQLKTYNYFYPILSKNARRVTFVNISFTTKQTSFSISKLSQNNTESFKVAQIQETFPKGEVVILGSLNVYNINTYWWRWIRCWEDLIFTPNKRRYDGCFISR